MIVGVDGYKKGWIAAIEGKDGPTYLETFHNFADIVTRLDFTLVVIDVPIGLTDRGPRAADLAARRFLGQRACCVFRAPIRELLGCHSQSDASEKWKAAEARGCSAQLWGIIQKIREVDTIMSEGPNLQQRVLEGHPEVSFAVLNSGRPVALGKKTKEGKAERLRLLRTYFGQEADEALMRLPRGAHLDGIDAYAMLWTAKRIRAGDGMHFPSSAELDSHSLRMEIVA